MTRKRLFNITWGHTVYKSCTILKILTLGAPVVGSIVRSWSRSDHQYYTADIQLAPYVRSCHERKKAMFDTRLYHWWFACQNSSFVQPWQQTEARPPVTAVTPESVFQQVAGCRIFVAIYAVVCQLVWSVLTKCYWHRCSSCFYSSVSASTLRWSYVAAVLSVRCDGHLVHSVRCWNANKINEAALL